MMIWGLLAMVTDGTVRFTGDLGSGLCFCGLGAGLQILQNL